MYLYHPRTVVLYCEGKICIDKLYFLLLKTLPFYSKFHLFLVKYEVSSSRIKGLSDKFYIACPPPGPGFPSRAVNKPSQCPEKVPTRTFSLHLAESAY